MQPLAERMRPSRIEDFVGQEHLVAPGAVLRNMLQSQQLSSFILWGPPGVGKTTLARIIAGSLDREFYTLSAVSSGVKDVREVIQRAESGRMFAKGAPILFIDEIHRFNKTQQDAILPYVEDGTIILIGATTENPSFEVTSPLLSRAQVMTLNPLVEDEIRVIVMRALRDRLKGLGSIKVEMDHDAIEHLISMARGDARIALNALELAVMSTPPDADGKLSDLSDEAVGLLEGYPGPVGGVVAEGRVPVVLDAGKDRRGVVARSKRPGD